MDSALGLLGGRVDGCFGGSVCWDGVVVFIFGAGGTGWL